MSRIKVKYIGCSDEQAIWGKTADPRKSLTIGKIYELERKEICSWHTLYFLKGFDIGKGFNSVCFEKVAELQKQPVCKTCGGKGKVYNIAGGAGTGSPILEPCPDCQKQPEAGEFTKDWIASEIGEGVHKGLRVTDNENADLAYKAIAKMPDKQWSSIVEFVAEIIYKQACSRLDRQEEEIQKVKDLLQEIEEQCASFLEKLVTSKGE